MSQNRNIIKYKQVLRDTYFHNDTISILPPSELSRDTLLEIKNLNLVFDVNYYRPHTLRDAFVSMIKNPVNFLAASNDKIYALNNINLLINRGERVGVIGSNGSGKTTLCRLISKMIYPTSGTLTINGNTRSIFSSLVGINPYLTGRENAKLLGKLFFPDLSRDELKEIINQALEFSELKEFLDVPYHFYSKGMQARLCLSIVSSKSCDFLVLDEVFDGADEYFKRKVSKRIKEIIYNSGSVVFVSHATDQIKEVCNRVIVLDKSKIIFDGDVESGIRAYQNLIPN